MRKILTLMLTGAFLCIFGYTVRHQLRELGQVIRTYMSFSPYLEHHPASLYRYQPSTDATLDAHNAHSLVPAIIHRVYLQEGQNVSLSLDRHPETSCNILHPNWTHFLWTDSVASSFIAQHYPQLSRQYEAYTQTIQRANVLRYALLDHYGGVYLDLDIDCLRPLDDLRHLPWLTPGAYPTGVNNAFVLSRPHHPFLAHLLGALEKSDLRWSLPYVENMLSTGCMFFSNQWMSYVRALPDNTNLSEDGLLVLASEDGRLEPHMLRGAVTTPLFRHGGASSWHDWDAAAIVLIGKYYVMVAVVVSLGLVFAILLVCRCPKRFLQRILMRPTGSQCLGLVKDSDEEARLLRRLEQ